MLTKISKKIILLVFLLVLIYVVNHSVGTGVNHLEINTDNLNFTRILFVPGINTPQFYLARWEKDLIANFPDKEIIFLAENIYFYWQEDKTEKIVQQGVTLLNDGQPTIILSHSYGGVLAKTMISRAEQAQVVKLITMASPHQMNVFGLDTAKDSLDTPEEVAVPTYSFGGFIDPIVLFPFSDVGDSNHLDLWSSHSGFLFNKNIRKQVLEYAFGATTSEVD
jgi:predicted alpha/beta hydrolase family esterase